MIADILGRWAIIHIEIDQVQLTGCGIYGPNQNDLRVFDVITTELLTWPGKLLILGDFNCVLNYSVDATNSSATSV